MIVTKYIAPFIFLFYSCNEKRSSVHNDEAFINSFNYPDDLNNFDTLSYDGNTIQTPTGIEKFATSRYSGNNFAYYEYPPNNLRLLIDSKNNLILGFVNPSGNRLFTRTSIEKIYFIKSNGMPEFLLLCKNNKLKEFVYKDNSHEVELKELNITEKISLKSDSLNYSTLVRLNEMLFKKQFYRTGNSETLDKFFYNVPYWVEY